MSAATIPQVVSKLEDELERVWLDEPAEITLLRNGMTSGTGGSRGQTFSVLVHLEGMLMLLGPHVLFRLLLLAENQRVDVDALKETVLALFKTPFDQFVFLGDLGLREAGSLGSLYLDGIEAVQTRQEFQQLTGAFAAYMNRMFRWVYGIFPWNLGGVYPQRSATDIDELLRAMAAVRERFPEHHDEGEQSRS